MTPKSEFIYIANRMLEEAVAEVAIDQNSEPKKLSEPSHTAAIVSKFPSLMNDRWGGAKCKRPNLGPVRILLR